AFRGRHTSQETTMLAHESIHSLPAESAELPPDDHRALIARLDLCHFQDDAPAMVFWHPRGFTLYRLLEDAARAHVLAAGYRQVRTPQLLRRAVWAIGRASCRSRV